MSSLEMMATGLYHIPSGKMGRDGTVIEPREQLRALQQAVIEAVKSRVHGAHAPSPCEHSASGTESKRAFLPDNFRCR
jgi:hypothetical protein